MAPSTLTPDSPPPRTVISTLFPTQQSVCPHLAWLRRLFPSRASVTFLRAMYGTSLGTSDCGNALCLLAYLCSGSASQCAAAEPPECYLHHSCSMTGGKKSSREKKKRRRSLSCDPGHQVARKRRSTESSQQEPESSVVLSEAKEEDVEELSDIEEGGLDLSVPLKPISFYIADRKEMLEHCFRVLGDRKLKKMLPDMLQDLSLDEIKQLCLEQVEMETDESLLRILQGDHGIDSNTEEENEGHTHKSGMGPVCQNDNLETTSLKANSEFEEADAKTGKGEDYDALSINADTYDSDIEGASCEERIHETPITTGIKPAGQPDDLVMDIEKSVNEILGLAEPVVEVVPTVPVAVLPEDIQPSAQQLELLELEMRARAIKALMKAGDVKKS